MPVISDAIFLVTLPSGNKAVYSLQPQHVSPPHSAVLPDPRPGALGANGSLTDRCIRHGKQLAHEKDGKWYRPGGWDEIVDLRTIALLERASDAESPAVQATYWVHRAPAGLCELRQIRFREQFLAGARHPNDVCAVARTEPELRSMVEACKLGPVDWTLGSQS